VYKRLNSRLIYRNNNWERDFSKFSDKISKGLVVELLTMGIVVPETC